MILKIQFFLLNFGFEMTGVNGREKVSHLWS